MHYINFARGRTQSCNAVMGSVNMLSLVIVGDGINDAPSLAKENAASDAASVVLLGNRVSQVVDALSLSKATMAKVHQNLAWAVAYNIFAVSNSLLLQLHGSFQNTEKPQGDLSSTKLIQFGLSTKMVQDHRVWLLVFQLWLKTYVQAETSRSKLVNLSLL
ncbi:uncharacterized protein LOC133916764 isoform X2 [Phragmites australis]|uniref:uncharacterized protein LOC133916764 isoform X2 n=1 Tax=Phragmites australis TaxID=29695 RepID=UPI002D79E334|nr:uncharacterized protein LOC133916764 isoform X2 [Phragmites australis]